MSDNLDNSTTPPFHKTELYQRLSAEQSQLYEAYKDDPLEVARVTVLYGNLIQSAYTDYRVAETTRVLADYQLRAWQDGASYGN